MFGRGLPKEVRTRLGIPASERIVAWGTGVTGRPDAAVYAVASDRALYLDATGERLPWDRISRAQWDEPMLDLVVVDADGQPDRLVRVPLMVGSALPAAVHAQVTESVVVSERLQLGDGASALAVARRSSDADVIWWSIVFDAGLDPKDPELRARADAALAELRAALGI
jgi:hypothetical protein